MKAVAVAAEADELESLLADVEEAAAATPAASPLCTPATSTATRRTDPLLLLLPLLATAVGIIVGGVALVGTSSSSRSPPASPPSAVSMLPDPASPPPVPPFSLRHCASSALQHRPIRRLCAGSSAESVLSLLLLVQPCETAAMAAARAGRAASDSGGAICSRHFSTRPWPSTLS